MYLQPLAWPQGQLTAVWTAAGLLKLSFGTVELPGAAPLTPELARQPGPRSLSQALSAYFDQQADLKFSLDHLDWAGVPEFHQHALRCCAQISRGQFMTYGQLAAAVGSPHAARAVGQAMARNRWPLIVPCHRVVGQRGKLTGYSGLGGTDTKLWLLAMEGLSAIDLKTQRRQRLLRHPAKTCSAPPQANI